MRITRHVLTPMQNVFTIYEHRGQSLVTIVRDYVEFFDRYEISFPELNAGPLLWRLVRSLGLPRP